MDGGRVTPKGFGAAFKAFMEAVAREAAPQAGGLAERIREHLGTDPAVLPTTAEEFDAHDHPNVQVALDDYLAGPGRSAELLGVGMEQKRYFDLGLSDLVMAPGSGAGGRPPVEEGPVDYVNFHLAGGRILGCVQFGLYLITEGEGRLAVFVTGPSDAHGPRQKLRVQTMSERPEEGAAFLAGLRETTRRLNVYRGQTISLSPGMLGMGPQSLVAFHALRVVDRADVILPEGTLERIERETVGFAAQAERLLAAGRSLKRGMLLYGPPGTGKTLTITYLIGQLPGRTTILTTGMGMGLLAPVAQLARELAPAMVVLEDVDLIAEERGSPFGSSGPLLFELLNELDGLGDDCDVIFVLTTNRPEILEPALAARPGRVDLTVELPLPDAAGRRRLFDLYARGLTLADDVDIEGVVGRTEGASPAYLKELLRKAATMAATGSGAASVDQDGLTVTGADVEAALAELDEGGRLARRLLGYGGSEGGETGARRGMGTGFPGERGKGREMGFGWSEG